MRTEQSVELTQTLQWRMADCETIRIHVPPLMSKRTIRIPGEGGRRRRRGVDGTLGGPSSQKKES